MMRFRTAKKPGEVLPISIDLVDVLETGETINAAAFTAAAEFAGTVTDPDPSSFLVGSAAIIGTTVAQFVQGGLDGLDYLLTLTVTTSAGRTLIEEAVLPVRAR